MCLGVFLDSYGPRLTAFGAMSLAATACFIYAFADNHGAFMFATLCLGATSASQLSVQSFSSLFFGYEGLYMCTLSWTFQASCIAFFLVIIRHVCALSVFDVTCQGFDSKRYLFKTAMFFYIWKSCVVFGSSSFVFTAIKDIQVCIKITDIWRGNLLINLCYKFYRMIKMTWATPLDFCHIIQHDEL